MYQSKTLYILGYNFAKWMLQKKNVLNTRIKNITFDRNLFKYIKKSTERNKFLTKKFPYFLTFIQIFSFSFSYILDAATWE